MKSLIKTIICLMIAAVVVASLIRWLNFRKVQTFPPATIRQTAEVPKVLPASRPALTITNNVLAQQTKPQSQASLIETILNESADFKLRLAAVHSLKNRLTEKDLTALLGFLRTKNPQDEFPDGQFLKNEVMDALCYGVPQPAQLGDVLVQLYRDHSQDEVIRDYAVQHMVAFYQSQANQNSAAPASLGQIHDALWEAVAETDSSIAGTALLGLSHLVEYPEFNRDQVAAIALKLAAGGDVQGLAQITGLQVCANLGVTEALPLAVAAAQQDSNIPLQISAIGALGSLGANNSSAKDLLNQLQANSETRSALPAGVALNRILKQERQTASTSKG